jgi:hypothetical protein
MDLHDIDELDPGECDLCTGQFFLLQQTLLAQLPYTSRKQQNLCNHLQSHQNGSYLQIITNVLLICLVVHTAENFLHVFICFLFGDTSKLATISYFHFRNFLHVVELQHSPPLSNWWGVENSATCYKLLYGEKKKAKYSCL